MTEMKGPQFFNLLRIIYCIVYCIAYCLYIFMDFALLLTVLMILFCCYLGKCGTVILFHS